MLAERVDQWHTIGSKVMKFARVIDLERGFPALDDIPPIIRVAEPPADKPADQGDRADDQNLDEPERKERRVDVPFFVPESRADSQSGQRGQPSDQEHQIEGLSPGCRIILMFSGIGILHRNPSHFLTAAG